MQDKEILDKGEDSLSNENGGKKPAAEREDSFGEDQQQHSTSKKDHQSTKDGKFAFRKMKQPKKEKADKKSGIAKFAGEGVSFKAKLIGSEEVSDARGDKMCQDSMFRLKMNVKNQGPHKRKIAIYVSLEGIKIKDEKSGDLIYHHPVARISFISQDIGDARAFGYVASSADGSHEFLGIKTEKPAFHVVLALRDLFQTVLSLKQEKMEQVKEKKSESFGATAVTSDSLQQQQQQQKTKQPFVENEGEYAALKDITKSENDNIYFDVILSEPFQVKDSEADLSTSSCEEKETKTVDDLLCLQDELEKLQQGIAQMDTSIAAVSETIGEEDPFDTSFLAPGAPKRMPAPVPVPVSRPSPANNQPMFEDKYAVFAALDNEPSVFDSANQRKEDDQKQGGDVSVPEMQDLEDEIKRKSVAPAKPPRNAKAPAADLSVFADLDPLGKDRPYIDKTEFFHELKNPPKKVLKDLLDNSSSSHEDLMLKAFDNGIGSPPNPFPVPSSELSASVHQKQPSLASSLPNSFLGNVKFSAFTQNGTNGNPFNPFGNESSAFQSNHINGYPQVAHHPQNHLTFGPSPNKRDSLGSSSASSTSSHDSECSSPIPIPMRSSSQQQFFEPRNRAMSNDSTSTSSYSRSPIGSSRSSSQADVSGSSPRMMMMIKLTNGHHQNGHDKSIAGSDSSPPNGTSEHPNQQITVNGKSSKNAQNGMSRPRPRPSLNKGNSLTNGGIPVPSHLPAEPAENINRENMQSIANMLQVQGLRSRAASLPVDNRIVKIPYPAEKNIFAKKSDPFSDEFFCSLPKKMPNHISTAAEIQEYA